VVARSTSNVPVGFAGRRETPMGGHDGDRAARLGDGGEQAEAVRPRWRRWTALGRATLDLKRGQAAAQM